MAKKKNESFNGYEYFRIRKKIGVKWDPKKEIFVDDIRTFRGPSKKDAEAKYQAFLDARAKGLASENQHFAWYAEKFIETVFLQDTKLAVGTKELYLNAWNSHIRPSALYGMKLSEIQSIDIQTLYNALDCSPSALTNCHKLMRRFFKYLDREGICRDLTTSLVLPAKNSAETPQTAADAGKISEVEVWSDTELKAILGGFDKAQRGFRLRFFIFLALNTGLRISEILALTYDDLQNGEVSVYKQAHTVAKFEGAATSSHRIEVTPCKSTYSVRTIPLTADVMKELEIHKAWQRLDMMKNGYRTNYVFTTSSGALYDRQGVSASLDRYYKRIGVPARGPHTYRRTFGTNLSHAGVPIEVTSKLMGHSSIDITYKYYIGIEAEQKRNSITLMSQFLSQHTS